jgi:hypothetical protein
MEAQAAHTLLSHAQRARTGFGGEMGSGVAQKGQTQVLGDRGLHMEGPTWEEKVDGEIERTETYLQQRLYGNDGVLEVLMVGPGASPPT